MPRKPIPEPFPEDVLESAGVLDRLADEIAADSGPRVFLQDSIPDKYSVPPAEPIDCDNRVALCKAACCRLSVLLSPQDLAEGIVSWDPRRRYFNSQQSDGYCAHLERPECRCSIYTNRPAACRIYDCRHDGRIWIDFENRVPHPALNELDWPLNIVDLNEPQQASKPRSEKPQEDAKFDRDTARSQRKP